MRTQSIRWKTPVWHPLPAMTPGCGGDTLAKLSGSQLGELVTFTAAQFSQKQEQEAG